MNSYSQQAINVGPYTLLPRSILGKGATGTVYKGINKQTQQNVAIKAIDLKTINDEATKSLLQNEKNALKLMKSDNVLRLLDIIETNGFCYLITQLVEGITLKQYLQHKSFSEEEAVALFRKILTGCVSITRSNVIHRDLKPANIMITKQMNPVIIDFGYSQVISHMGVMKSFNVGSPSYMSPQAYLRTLYSQKSDSWSLGVILYEMLHKKTLDEGMNIKQYFQLVKNNQNFISSKISSNVSAEVRKIIEGALKFSSQQRMTISNMKYETDLYSISKNKKTTLNINPQSIDLTKNLTKNQSFTSRPPKPIKTIEFRKTTNNFVQNTNSNLPQANRSSQASFVSFEQFRKRIQPPPAQINILQNYNSVPVPTHSNKTSMLVRGNGSINKTSAIHYYPAAPKMHIPLYDITKQKLMQPATPINLGSSGQFNQSAKDFFYRSTTPMAVQQVGVRTMRYM